MAINLASAIRSGINESGHPLAPRADSLCVDDRTQVTPDRAG